jgi:hypothetical protein
MLRVLFEIVLPFLAPFLAYGLWRLLVTGPGRAFADGLPWYALTAAGLLLAGASVLALAFLPGAPPEAIYVPPHMEGSRLVPGQFILPAPHP